MLDFLIHHSPLLYLTQSLWRDEVFSIFMSEKSITFFSSHLSFEPPFYYLLLHFWMKLFGQSEIAVRSLSLLAFTGATVIVVFWSEKLFKKHWLSWWLPLFFFLNPMLLYYAMEVRTYGWYIFFATLSLWAYAHNKWKIWIVATVLGFYTHSYVIIVPFAQTIHYLIIHRKKLLDHGIKSLSQDPMMRSLLVAALCIAPWTLKLIAEAQKLKSSWYFPVDTNLVTSVLGNLFVGYEGTPWYLWNFTKIVSLIILGCSFVALRSKVTRASASLFIAQLYLPLIIVIGISFLKPLYVNRYVIAVTIAEVFIIALTIQTISRPWIQKIAAAIALLFVVGFNIWYPNKHAKLDIRKTMTEINTLKADTDVIMADSSLIFFEAIYYSPDKTHVYLYNPYHYAFPWYVGDSVVSTSQMANDYPPYPMRAFVVHADGTFNIAFQTPMLVRKTSK